MSVQNRYNAADRVRIADRPCEQDTGSCRAPVQESDKNPAVSPPPGGLARPSAGHWPDAGHVPADPARPGHRPTNTPEKIAAASVELTPDEVEAISKGG
jgi:hypothetical protein